MEEVTRTGQDGPAAPGSRFPAGPERLNALDAHRGLIIILMAIDHASMFIARAHSREFWGVPLPVYPDGYWFWTRWITHVCAPAFFFLMGAGMMLFADARRRVGWHEGKIAGFFVVRGFILIILQLFVENAAWMVGDLPARSAFVTVRGAIPGAGGDGLSVYLGVLYALGGTMIFWGLTIRRSSAFIGIVSLCAVLLGQIAVPGPDKSGAPFSPMLRLLLIPGYTGGLVVFYPVIPWLGVTGLGLLFGRLLREDPGRTRRLTGLTGIGLLLLFPVIRVSGGFGNLAEVPAGWMGFLNVVKYPPSLAFLAVTLGLNFLLISGWGLAEPYVRSPRHPLTVFGRAALFFYLAHLWLYGLTGFFFPEGSSLAVMYLIWLAGLLLLYPLCYWYNNYKQRKPLTSLWRFF